MINHGVGNQIRGNSTDWTRPRPPPHKILDFQIFENSIFEKIKVVAYTQNIPNDVVAVRKGLDPLLKENIKQGLKFIAKSSDVSKVLKKVYGISGLADLDAFFDPVRQAGELLGLGF